MNLNEISDGEWPAFMKSVLQEDYDRSVRDSIVQKFEELALESEGAYATYPPAEYTPGVKYPPHRCVMCDGEKYVNRLEGLNVTRPGTDPSWEKVS